MTHHHAHPLRACAVAATTLCICSLAQAQFSTDGYFRAGTGARDPLQCFGLAGAGLKYRLGNECDTYVEFNLKNTMKVGDIQFSGNIMPVYAGAGQNASAKDLGQVFIEGSGFDIAPKLNFWVGKRYYGRSEVHITDTKYTQLDGTGGGADNIEIGGGKLGVSYFRRDPGFAGWGTASRVNVEYSTSNVNEGGWLRVLAGFVTSDETVDKDGAPLEGRNGTSLTVQHYQHNLFGLGGGNTVWLQIARGSAALNGGFGNAFSGNGNDWIPTDPSGTSFVEDHGSPSSWRIANSFSWQAGNIAGTAVAHVQEDDSLRFKTRSISLGGRAAYSFTNNFKLVGEAGYSTKKPGNAAVQKLAKATIAPTLSVGPGLMDRPELRLFYTRAKWNAPASAAGNGLRADETSGTRYGVQAEIWW